MTAPYPEYFHDPQAVRVYGWNWALDAYGNPGYLATGDQLVASTWVCSSPAVIFGAASFTATQTEVSISISNAKSYIGQLFTVTNHITTLNGTQDNRSFTLQIQNC